MLLMLMATRDAVDQHLLEHHQVITRREAHGLGMTHHEIDGKVRRREWRAPTTGVYVVATSTWTHTQALTVAVRSVGPIVAISHVSSASVFGLTERCPNPPWLTVPTTRRPRRPGTRIVRTADVPVVIVKSLPCTPLGRTLVDCAAVVDDCELGLMIDRAVIRHALDVDGLARRLREGRRRPGTLALLAHLAERGADGAPPPSVLERHLHDRMAEAELPPPVREHRVAAENRSFRLDAAFPDLHLAYEVDGRAFHSNAEQTRYDHWRRGLLADHGWTVQVLAWRDVVTPNAQVTRQLRRSFDMALQRAITG